MLTGILRIAISLFCLIAMGDVARELRSLLPEESGRKAWEIPSIVASQASAAPMFFIPVWIEIGSPIFDLMDLWVFAVSASLLVFSAWIVFRAVKDRQDVTLSKAWTAVVAILPLMGLLQFGFQNFYKPGHDRPSIELMAKLDEIRHGDGVTHMRGTITVVNVGPAGADVLGSMYAVTGRRNNEPNSLEPLQAASALKTPALSSSQKDNYSGLLKIGHVVRGGDSLPPGRKWSTSFVFDVDNNDQQVVRLQVALSLLTHTTNLGRPVRCLDRFHRTLLECAQTGLPAQSWVRRVLGDEPRAQTVVFFSRSRPPVLATKYQYAGRDFVNDERELVGLGRVETVDPLVRDTRALTSIEYRLDP
ncbi:hypothetical protein [Streptomyces chartreusis]